jgi:predicted transcriptional regulator
MVITIIKVSFFKVRVRPKDSITYIMNQNNSISIVTKQGCGLIHAGRGVLHLTPCPHRLQVQAGSYPMGIGSSCSLLERQNCEAARSPPYTAECNISSYSHSYMLSSARVHSEEPN